VFSLSPIAFQIFNLISVGCRTNQYEIQALKEQLEAVGCFYVEKDADLYIVNTAVLRKGQRAPPDALLTPL